MRRRDFIAGIGGAIGWPHVVCAQQSNRLRRIAVLMHLAADDPEAVVRIAAFAQGLQEAGWTIGRNIQIDTRWAAGDWERFRHYAAELVALAPDVILASTTPSVRALQEASRTIPIVFVAVTDPVGQGFVSGLARPGGSTTGFAGAEFGMAPKWLELLKEIAPRVTRVAVLRDPTLASGSGLLGAILGVAPSFGVEASPIDVRNTDEMEHNVATFARGSNGGLIVPSTPGVAVHRGQIIALAARHKLPAVYSLRHYVTGGGLMSYGFDVTDTYRQAAGYVDRILKGEKPADLAVQRPTKFQLVINLKTAKTMGLTVPPTLLARTDEVIE